MNISAPSPSSLRDLAGNAPLTEVARASMSVVDSIQSIPHQGARLMGMACAFLLAAEAANIRIPDMIGMARNCMNTAEGKKPEFKAASRYIREEIFSINHQ